ncbi:MAG: ATP-binding protein, partial [Thiohalocapsa sp.]
INEAGRDLRTMIDNILDISRIEAGPVTVSLEWVEVAPMLNELIVMVGPIFSEKGLTLRVETDAAAPPRIYSDRDKLRQILKNFLSNAAKFTDTGSVVVSLAPSQGPCALIIAVTDTGIGIPPGKEQIIFDAFQQADGSTRRRYGGTGLGLSISRELAELLGGYIDVESKPGQGSRFRLHLPLSLDPEDLDAVEIIERLDAGDRDELPTVAPDSPERGRPSAEEKAARSTHWVLLVERDVRSLVAIASELEALGVRVQTAADGEEALETLQDETDCALLLLALSASPRDSCDTIARVRAEPVLSELPIVILGDLDQMQRDKCLEAGACGFLAKPVLAEALSAMLDEALERPRYPLANSAVSAE